MTRDDRFEDLENSERIAEEANSRAKSLQMDGNKKSIEDQ